MNFTLSNFEIKLDLPESIIDIAHTLEENLSIQQIGVRARFRCSKD